MIFLTPTPQAPPKTGSSGKDFSVWKLTDLRGNCAPVSLFLFGRAHKDHWKIPLHKVVGILNPKALEDKAGGGGGKEGLTLSIDHPDKLLELGDSADIGKCAHRKADGVGCSQVVNLSECSYCVFHVKAAYKASAGQRQSLQSSFSGGGQGRGGWGGKGRGGNPESRDFAPVVGRQSAAARARDNKLLAGLGGGVGGAGREVAAVVASGRDRQGRPRGALLSQHQKDVVALVTKNVSEELGSRLLAPTPGARALLGTMTREKEKEDKKTNSMPAMSAKELLQSHTNSLNPTLGRGSLAMAGRGDEVSLDLDPRVKARYAEAGHAKALAILAMRKKGIAKVDPNKEFRTKDRKDDIKEKVKKRMRSDEEEENEVAAKKAKPGQKTVMVFGKEVSMEKLEEIRNKKSSNSHLAEEADLAAADKYFDKAAVRDELEQKMVATTSIAVKAVTCHLCNYTSFKSSELCREKGHRVKVINAKKRFFKCGDCKNRTVSLDRLPKVGQLTTQASPSHPLTSGGVQQVRGEQVGEGGDGGGEEGADPGLGGPQPQGQRGEVAR